MKKVIVIFYVAIGCLTFGQAQTNYSFTTINKDNGLIDNYVNQVFEDSRGFMWFATREGLCRFDGNSFVYHAMPKIHDFKISGISINYINSINEDEKQNLWIGTLAGIYILDQQKGTVKFLQKGFNESKDIFHNFVNLIVFDKSDHAWIGTRGGLSIYNKKNETFLNFSHDDKNPESLANNYICSICIDYKGEVWIGTRDGGLDKISADYKTFIHCNSSKNGVPDAHIRSVFEDSKQNLWVLTAQTGLFCKKKNSDTFNKIPIIDERNKKEVKTIFQDINEDIYGNLWIGTISDGLIVYNPQNKNCRFYDESIAFPHRICGNSIENISRDKHGNMWLATDGGGTSLFCPMTSWFSYYSKNQTANGLQGNLVSSFCEDHNGTMWIGTDGNGFAKFNVSNGNFETYNKDNGLSSNAVLDIVEIKPNILAIATYSGGLHIFNTATKTIKQYLYTNSRTDYNLQNIYGLTCDKKTNLLWCNTFGDGIQLFDCNSMSFLTDKQRLAICKLLNKSMFSSKTLFDKASNIWIADGSMFLKFHDTTLTNYTQIDSSKKGSVSANFVSDILCDSKQKIWVSTYSGVMTYNNDSDYFRNFEKSDCNVSEARALLEDSLGNIWISTINSLFQYKSDKIQNISLAWGMPQMQYFRKSAYRNKSGKIFFGGLKGFVVIDEKAKHEVIEPKIYITKLFINEIEQKTTDSNALIKKDISFLSNLELSYDRNYLTIEFAALNFIDNAKSRFKYMLKGFNNTWIESGKDHRAQFTGIPPGDYTFLLNTTDSDGNWVDKALCLHITISPPWWKSIWFRLLLATTLLFAIWEIIKYREQSIKRQNKQLETLVALRTQELKATNDDLSKQKATIQEQYEAIKENHFVIEVKNAQLQDSLEMKDKLLTVIAHDFKNPMASLQGSLKLIQQKVENKGYATIKKNIDSVVASSSNIVEQMLSILEWSLSNDKTIVQIPINVNLKYLVSDVLTLVVDLVKRHNVTIKVEDTCHFAAYVDPRMMSAVIRNIVINAIKFTPEKGKITIKIYHSDDSVILEIEDSGKGMEQSFIDQLLLDEDVQIIDYPSGFGLMICKAFIKRNKGSWKIKSQLGKGTTFRIFLPRGEYSKNEPQEIDKFDKIEQALEYENIEMAMLIIDDNKDIIGYLSELFSGSFTVYGANDGKKGLQIAHNTVPDIILCDVAMPVLNGIEFCKHIKSDALTCHIPVILLSAKSQLNHQLEGLQSGADDYITKPFDATILQQKVHSIIKNRKLLHKHSASNNVIEKIELPESYDDKLINEVTDYIRKNLSESTLSIDSMGKDLGLSRLQLYRKFTGVVGQSPKEYILALKFQTAIEMLKTKKYRISDIAFELGFNDSHYFSNSFKKKFGVSPSDYFSKNTDEKER